MRELRTPPDRHTVTARTVQAITIDLDASPTATLTATVIDGATFEFASTSWVDGKLVVTIPPRAPGGHLLQVRTPARVAYVARLDAR